MGRVRFHSKSPIFNLTHGGKFVTAAEDGALRYPAFIESDFHFPEFCRVRMRFRADAVEDPAAAVTRELDRLLSESGIRAGDRVALGVGSRGIDRLGLLVQAVCTRLKEAGARPFIVPAMGSHGGATAEGQAAVLRRLQVTEESCGAPVVSSMEVDRIGTVLGEVPLYFSRDALAADHSIVLNRIKPHTKFVGPAESGILKMLCIGLGKHAGAVAYHTFAMKYGFFPLLEAMGEGVAAAANFRFGLAVVENAYDRLMTVAGVPAGRCSSRRPASTRLPRPTCRGCRSRTWTCWWWGGSARRSAVRAWTRT
jgi:hypothetical protein